MTTEAAACGSSSMHGRIARALLVGVVFLAVAKLAGLAKELLMAWRFGSAPVADSYALTFGVISWPLAVWMSVATGLLVPLLVRASADDVKGLTRFRQELLGATLVVGASIGVLVFLGLQLGLGAGALGVQDARFLEVARMIGPVSLILPLGALSAVLTCFLLAKRSQVSTLFDGLPALTLFAALLVLPDVDGRIVAWGTAAGFAIQLVVLAAAQGFVDIRPRIGFRSPLWSMFWQGMGVLLASQAVVSLTGVIDQLAMAHLGPTSNATLGYATRLLSLLQSLVGLAVTRALLPILSGSDFDQEDSRWKLTVQWTGLLFLGGLFVSVAGWIMAPGLVSLLFQRGEFSAEDAARVSEALRFGVLQIPFYCASLVLAQYVAATRRYGLFLWGNGLGLLVKLAANAALIPLFGVAGAMGASAVMYLVSLIFLLCFGHRHAVRSPKESL